MRKRSGGLLDLDDRAYVHDGLEGQGFGESESRQPYTHVPRISVSDVTDQERGDSRFAAASLALSRRVDKARPANIRVLRTTRVRNRNRTVANFGGKKILSPVRRRTRDTDLLFPHTRLIVVKLSFFNPDT